jgi:Holliday junction resolvase RusA-like endonuclease
MQNLSKPKFSFWVAGKPRSLAAENQKAYRERVRDAGAKAVATPSKSNRLDVEILFASKERSLRADVDNIGKPVLDALKDVVYTDDRQVRSIRVIALPLDDAFKVTGPMSQETYERLLSCEEFLIVIRDNEALEISLP